MSAGVPMGMGADIENLMYLFFFCGLFFEGVYNSRQVKTVGGSDSILFSF